ncbi:SorA family sulfite dehydrogenase catalytic subunit [Rhizorhapis sp. SPR117]|uniref:SorA family sulfite dehydrogenase catalytic subunit n=1 Tax=Rhizorhapis sp. SPR117 TaxID=2912611 RepID=UPI001F356501|nr:molybdopterin-dependent oxidoreductase [Rhizorhapis sp. SPR117]
MLDRRQLLVGMGASALSAGRAGAEMITLPFANGRRPLVRYPGKRLMIGLTARPPQLETPFGVFSEGLLTPNDAFFVRYHMSDIPLSIDIASYRLKIGGHVEKPLSLSLNDLKRTFGPTEIIAVNQCSGNSRGFFEPRVSGGQLGNGAMGNALWTGVPLKAVLERAGIKAGAQQVTFNGLDNPPAPNMPDFVKALASDQATDGEVMLAWAMNGQDLPFLNGYPLRLIVPGYFGTYWVKHLSDITVLDARFDGYWMKTAYRVPDNDCHCVPVGTKPASTRPIGKLAVRSFITSHADGAQLSGGKPVIISGIAFDSGSGIAKVELSADGGRAWKDAMLGEDLGRYSFRPWTLALDLPRGDQAVKVRATSRSGETQPMEPSWNPAGYLRNVIETVRVRVA